MEASELKDAKDGKAKVEETQGFEGLDSKSKKWKKPVRRWDVARVAAETADTSRREGDTVVNPVMFRKRQSLQHDTVEGTLYLPGGVPAIVNIVAVGYRTHISTSSPHTLFGCNLVPFSRVTTSQTAPLRSKCSHHA